MSQRSGHKGKPHEDRWQVKRSDNLHKRDIFFAVRVIDERREKVMLKAHCTICAKAKVLREYGGKIDCRGINHPGINPECAKGLRDAIANQA